MSKKIPRIVSAALAEAGYVDLQWDDGRAWRVDLTPDLPGDCGSPRIVDDGYTLEFDGTDVDFSSPDLYKRAAWQSGQSPRPEEFRAWRKRAGLSQEKLAEIFDIGRRTIGYYEDGTMLIPRIVALAMRGYDASGRAAE